jgi:cation transport ATPase
MKDSDIFDNYKEYVKGLTTSDLESIYRDIDKASYPDRHKIVSDEIKERISKEGPDYNQKKGEEDEDSHSKWIIGIVLFLCLLGFELYLGKEQFRDTYIPQLSRFALIVSVAFLGAIFTRKEGIHSIKSTLIFLSLGFGIVGFAVIPRYLEHGMSSTINMMLLKESILGNYEDAKFSFKSSFYLATGYVFLCWALIDNLQNIIRAIKENT